MKDQNFKKILVCLLIGATLTTVSCSKEEEAPTVSELPTASIKEDVYNEKIAYCMEQISALEEQLKAAKEQNYVNENSYKVEISALETTINSLKSQLESYTSAGNNSNQNNNYGSTGNLGNTGNNTYTPPTNQDNFGTNNSYDNLVSTPQALPYTYAKENGGITIKKYTGYDSEVTIPEKIDGLPVLCIGESAFEASPVKVVKIPEGITKIDWFAFRACTQLCEINIPASVRSIEYGAFDSAKTSFIIICPKTSFAEAYAKSWGYICVAK